MVVRSYIKNLTTIPARRLPRGGSNSGLSTNDEYCSRVAHRSVVYNSSPPYLPENPCENSREAQDAINRTARYSLNHRPSIIFNSGKIDEARPVAREHRSQKLRSFSRPSQFFPYISQVFTDCYLD